MSNLYTLVVSGERFDFTPEQFATEPSNLLFVGLGGRREFHLDNESFLRRTHTRELLAEPAIFKLIQAHLRGYEILPLSDAAVPHYMQKDTMVTNLLFEAERWQLKNLAERINEYLDLDLRPQGSSRKTFKLSVSDILVFALLIGSVLN
jgi:hypothetical protein